MRYRPLGIYDFLIFHLNVIASQYLLVITNKNKDKVTHALNIFKVLI